MKDEVETELPLLTRFVGFVLVDDVVLADDILSPGLGTFILHPSRLHP